MTGAKATHADPPSNTKRTKVTLEVRDITAAELSTMLGLTIISYKEYQLNSPPDFWPRYVANMTEAITGGPDTEKIAAFSEGRMVGCVLLCKHGLKSTNPEIRLLAVDPQFRQSGIAGALMSECERRVSERGHKQVMLHTTRLMTTARNMYEKSGYRRDEETDFFPVPDFQVMGFIKDL